MRIEVERLKDGIKGLKRGLNESECNRDYYIGYTSALSTLEGLIAGMEQDYRKCRDCKYISEKKHDKRYYTCNCPDKEIRKPTSLLRYSWEKACKHFEEREHEES